MMSTDIGAYVAAKAGGQADALAAGAGDNTEVSGPYVQRPDGALSVAVYVLYKAVLAEGETLSVAANLQDAGDSGGTGVADFGTALASTVVATGGSGGSTEQGAHKIGDFNLSAAKEYIRAQHTPNLSASATDTSRTQVVLIFGGQDSLPA